MARTQQQRREETVGASARGQHRDDHRGRIRAGVGRGDHQAGRGVGWGAVPALRHDGRLHGRDGLRSASAATGFVHQAGRRDTVRPAGAGGGADNSARHHQQLHQRGALRTDDRRAHRREAQRARCRHVLEQYTSKICDAARALPGADGFSQETFPVLVALLTNTFDGAAMLRAVLPQPEIEERANCAAVVLAERNRPAGLRSQRSVSLLTASSSLRDRTSSAR